jgi:hypothetical protein
MKKLLQFIFMGLFMVLFYQAKGATGDTTSVFVHTAVDMTWYGNYDRQGVFPDGSKSYRKVMMTYTMGCASGGCSDWDYTSQIFFRRPTGTYDSTLVSLDTLSMMPLIVDSTWNVYEVIQNMELGRVITPYGTYMDNNSNGYNNSWTHRNYFDVTDFVHLLKDSCSIRAFYSGWSSGFSVSLRFDFIEGTPPRPVLDIQTLYKGSKGYASSSDFESSYFNPKNSFCPSNAAHARIYSTITGHGFDNNVNCAEFCSRQYTVKTNGSTLGSALIWKDDCGDNPIFPQGGTWIYDRAGWCPGSKADIHEFEWNNFTTGANNSIDFDMQNYTWSGSQTPSYTVNAHVVYYGDHNFDNDAALIDVVAPSLHEEHQRKNPFCGNPIVRVKNMGGTNITSMTLEYGLEGAQQCTFDWTGNLSFYEEAAINLPTLIWENADFNNPNFNVSILTTNGMADEYPFDNSLKSKYEVPDVNTWPFLLMGVRTNNYANETSYNIEDAAGNIVFERQQGTLNANTLYKDSIFLTDGCYTLRVKDSGGDGLGWWANTAQGTGTVAFYSTFFTFVTYKNFSMDFGNELHYKFVWGALDSVQSSCTPILSNTDQLAAQQLTQRLFPNPTSGNLTLEIGSEVVQDYQIRILDIMGKVIQEHRIKQTDYSLVQIEILNQVSGVYFIETKSTTGAKRTSKFILLKD